MPIVAPRDSPFLFEAALAAGLVAVDRVVGPPVLLGNIVDVEVSVRPLTPMMVWTSPDPRLKTPVPSEQLQFPACWADSQQKVSLPQGSTTASVVFSSCRR
jgi:hypothetical protein